ncbi:ribbon-helix-helix domain-containing protein, partial [Heyndrickxia coagulans]|uniref:ribbon-helix-helix domain-containing protein n=3 Tax=Heyndrickxia TaxID=2837504 RepID=UPI002E1D77ED|nr:ribbon-helix-helix domain-containing protein [Heyndrickxia coagulans]
GHINSPHFVRKNFVYIDYTVKNPYNQYEVIIMREEKERVEIRMPKTILEKLGQYQKENGIPTRTAAILELLRKGLEK